MVITFLLCLPSPEAPPDWGFPDEARRYNALLYVLPFLSLALDSLVLDSRGSST